MDQAQLAESLSRTLLLLVVVTLVSYPACPFYYLRIHADGFPVQLLSQQLTHHALACTTIPYEYNIHDESFSMTTLRINSSGAPAPANLSNCRMAWLINISIRVGTGVQR